MQGNTIRSAIRSFLGTLLFNIFPSDKFLMTDTEFANPKNNKTPDSSVHNIDDSINSLEKSSHRLFQ